LSFPIAAADDAGFQPYWAVLQQQTTASQGLLCPHRRHERLDPDDVHDAREIVGQYVQGHFAATRGSVFIKKWVAHIRALVPKGCSTVSRRWRILSGCSSSRR
jgi:hypothetical protein